MQTTATQPVETSAVRNFIQEYFDAWERGDEEEILGYYSTDVLLRLPIGTLDGKQAVRDQFVRPFNLAFPGNVHEIQTLVAGEGVVAVEWRFKAEHSGVFNGISPTGRKVDVPGCSFYFWEDKTITAGHIYFNFPTLLEQLGADV